MTSSPPQTRSFVLRRISKRTAARKAECRQFREQLRREVGRCEICQHDPSQAKFGQIAWALHVHEIARGGHRQKAVDKAYAVLVLCWHCHVERVHGSEHWPEARQLAVLKTSRPQHFDLAKYNALIGLGPDRITEEEVSL